MNRSSWEKLNASHPLPFGDSEERNAGRLKTGFARPDSDLKLPEISSDQHEMVPGEEYVQIAQIGGEGGGGGRQDLCISQSIWPKELKVHILKGFLLP